MPLYEFACTACGSRFERLLPSSHEAPTCPRCGDPDVRRELSLFAAPSGSGVTTGCACGGACACGR